MGKVAIINSPLFAEKKLQYQEDSLPPFGLGYIATNLQRLGHDVHLIDAVASNHTILELLSIIQQLKPDVVAVNIFTTNFRLTQKLIEGISDETIRVIIGGLSTRTLYKDIFTWDTPNDIDVVFGDGELITGALVSRTEKESPIKSELHRRFFSADHNSSYFVTNISEVPLNRDFFINNTIMHPLGFKEICVITSRGCIFNCSFCAAARSRNRDMPIREMSEDAVVRDLKEIHEKYPDVTHIRILDDLFLKDANSIDKAIRIFDHYNLNWRSMAHVKTFHKVALTKIKALYERGCRELFVGVESGSPKILRKIHKTYDLDVIKECLQSIMEAGIGLKTYFVYGFPEETIEDFECTYILAKNLKEIALKLNVPFRTSVFQFRPYHDTEIFYELSLKQSIASDIFDISPNSDLSSLIGRDQFNFESGNYSNENIEIVHEFIERTSALKVPE